MDLICYALNVAKGLQVSDATTFKEVGKIIYSQRWLMEVNNEINSFMKNHTWKFVGLTEKQMVVDLRKDL